MKASEWVTRRYLEVTSKRIPEGISGLILKEIFDGIEEYLGKLLRKFLDDFLREEKITKKKNQ